MTAEINKRYYPKGYPSQKSFAKCGDVQEFGLGRTATCIIDNDHPGRSHWGPDADGIFKEWENGNENA